MASVSRPSRARSADRLSSSRFISRGCGQSFANDASIGTIECFRAWIRAIGMVDGLALARRALPPRPILVLVYHLSMISSENRFPLFRIMLVLLERHRVHQATLAPGRVQAALELERTGLADVALEDLGVVAAGLDGLQQPL